MPDLVKQTTPNPKQPHREIAAAIVLLTPNAEARVRANLHQPTSAADDQAFLREVYAPVVELTLTSTTRGSPLRRREALAKAKGGLEQELRKAVTAPGAATSSQQGGKKPKRTRKKKESAS